MKEKITKEIRKHFAVNGNEHTACQNLWHAAKAALVGKCMALNVRIRKERLQSNNLILHVKKSKVIQKQVEGKKR